MQRPLSKREPKSLLANRRGFLKFGAAGLVGGSLSSCQDESPPGDLNARRLGDPLSPSGEPSPFEKSARDVPTTRTPEAGSTRAPLQDSYGIITPSSLHFERHHAGVPAIDPAEHPLLIHGMVNRPLMLSVEEIKRLPSVSRVYFIECAGNSRSEWGSKTAPDAQRSHGLASCSEWTGALLSDLLAGVGVQPGATWIVAEGADACYMQRSIPISKAMDDILIAYGQNGEAIRPEQGYPLRLVVPGWEGNINVKWLRRLKLVDQPYMTRDETSKYTDLMADGTARLFTFEMEAKSVITRPSGGHQLRGPGRYEISGLAWSGRGAIERVEVSTDRGETWRDAALQEPRHPMAFTRFRLPWQWDGGEATLISRCTDDTGYLQPTREALIEVRGANSDYHNNCQKAWRVSADGGVTNVDA